jgi:hypothetical protein
MLVECDNLSYICCMKPNIKTYKVNIIQGVIGDMEMDNLGWLSKEQQQEFWDDHAKHVERLKAEGEYLKPVEISLSFVSFPPYDDEPKYPRPRPMENYRMIMLDLTNPPKNKE